MDIAGAVTLFSARHDAEVLLAHLLGRERSWIFAHPHEVLTTEQEEAVSGFARRRANGEPVAYIRGCQEFYRRTFSVDPSVLIPRPSTELLTELVIDWWQKPHDLLKTLDTEIVAVGIVLRQNHAPQTIVDCGTGSGCIAVTLACELPGVTVHATDISSAALATAQANASRHHVDGHIAWHAGNLLAPIATLTSPFVVVSNPPYIPEGTTLERDVGHFEPHEALFAGIDGLTVIRPLLTQAKEHPYCQGIVLECRSDQVAAIMDIVGR